MKELAKVGFTIVCLTILHVCPLAASAKDYPSKPQMVDCYLIKARDFYLGDCVLYVSQESVKYVGDHGDYVHIWSAPEWQTLILAPRKKLYSVRPTCDSADRIARNIRTIGIVPRREKWKLSGQSSSFGHPTAEYVYNDSKGLTGKAVFATDIVLSKALSQYYSIIYGIPDVKSPAVKVDYVVDGTPYRMVSTSQITKSKFPRSIFSLPKDVTLTDDVHSLRPGANSEDTKSILSDMLGVQGGDANQLHRTNSPSPKPATQKSK